MARLGWVMTGLVVLFLVGASAVPKLVGASAAIDSMVALEWPPQHLSTGCRRERRRPVPRAESPIDMAARRPMNSARELASADLDALLSLYEHLHATDAPLPARADLDSIWRKLCESEDHLYYGVDADGLLAASCTVTIVPNLTRGARPYGVIENVVTHSDHRRRGLGRIVVTRALDAAWRRGCYKVMLMSGMGRREIHSFYEALGFDRDAKQAFVARPA